MIKTFFVFSLIRLKNLFNIPSTLFLSSKQHYQKVFIIFILPFLPTKKKKILTFSNHFHTSGIKVKVKNTIIFQQFDKGVMTMMISVKAWVLLLLMVFFLSVSITNCLNLYFLACFHLLRFKCKNENVPLRY